jgi:hypothetical protein
MNAMPEHVATTTLSELNWIATALPGYVATVVTNRPQWCFRCSGEIVWPPPITTYDSGVPLLPPAA